MYSAVKINGQRLYELARKGIELERKGRKVRISSLNIIYTMMDARHPVIRFDVNCSKGTYIRTLCHDIGQRLGCGAHMSFLIRTGVGPFKLSQGVTLEEIKERHGGNSLQNVLLPVDIVFQNYPPVTVSGQGIRLFLNGAPAECRGFGNIDTDGEIVRVYSDDGIFIGIGKVFNENKKAVLKPLRIFAGHTFTGGSSLS